MSIDLNSIYQKIIGKIAIYEAIAAKTHKVDEETAKRIVSGELETFMTRVQNYLSDPKNSNATLTTVQGVNIFLEVMQSGLSFSQVANHVYISRMKGSGTAVAYKVTADGEIYQAVKAGAIDHLSEPVLVQVGEQFNIKNTPDGRQVAEHTIKFDGRPKFNINNFLVGYIYIVYPDGNRELSWIGAERMKEKMEKSQNKDMYNDESFVQTKVIKHALRKVRKTPFMQQLQAQDEEVITENREFEAPAPPANAQYQPTMVVSPPEPAPQPAPTNNYEPF